MSGAAGWGENLWLLRVRYYPDLTPLPGPLQGFCTNGYVETCARTWHSLELSQVTGKMGLLVDDVLFASGNFILYVYALCTYFTDICLLCISFGNFPNIRMPGVSSTAVKNTQPLVRIFST